ncbi:MAG: hypothetical protein NTY19_44430 [Planctomycetota bacterium]|nr:hypothetical protein [Planctomycetota bacterium]
MRKMIAATGGKFLCAAAKAVEAAILLSLGIPATVTAGLGKLGGSHLDQVKQDFQLDWEPPKSRCGIVYDELEGSQGQAMPDLVLVGCRLAEMSLQEPEGFSEIVSHLTGVERYLDVVLDRFTVWRPSTEAMKQIAFCREHADRRQVRLAILGSMEVSTEQLVAPRQSRELPKDLDEAIQKLLSLRSRPTTNVEDKRRAWDDIQRLIARGSIGPLRQAAKDAKDPLERNLWALAEMNGELLFPQLVRLLLQSRQEPGRGSPGRLVAYPDKEFRQLMEAMERQRRILKDISERKKNPF